MSDPPSKRVADLMQHSWASARYAGHCDVRLDLAVAAVESAEAETWIAEQNMEQALAITRQAEADAARWRGIAEEALGLCDGAEAWLGSFSMDPDKARDWQARYERLVRAAQEEADR